MNTRLACVIMVGMLSNAWPGTASAHALTLAECNEGGEFIRNAAHARDNGITREFFIGKLEEDLALIQAFPPALRWFVQDAGDEKLLTDAVLEVFDSPRKPDQHEAAFVRKCISVGTYADDGDGDII